jgi:hypothetical protein
MRDIVTENSCGNKLVAVDNIASDYWDIHTTEINHEKRKQSFYTILSSFQLAVTFECYPTLYVAADAVSGLVSHL